MNVKLIDEADYASTMERTILPALAQCRVEGWMEPAEADGLPTLPARPLPGGGTSDGGAVAPGASGIPASGALGAGDASAAHAGRLHYVCYDSARFDALREDGATGIFRGAIVISHGFT
ncbi:hypothetical protein JS533_012260, partial [Bifidobacterium amazonense]|nr:hypothetical protein [Bifidobacterium amazonense]